MAHFFLKAGESILMTNQNIIVEKGRYEAILTSRRLILVRSDDANASSREIPLREVGSVIAGENSLGIPTITLSHISADGVLRALELAFTPHAGDQNTFHYQEWVTRLKERVKIAAQEPAPADDVPPDEERIQKETPVPPDSTAELPEPAPADDVTPDEERIQVEMPVPPDSTAELQETPVTPSPGLRDTEPVKKDTRSSGLSPIKILILTLIIAAVIIGTFALPNISRGTPESEPAVTPDTTASPSVTDVVTTIIALPMITVTENQSATKGRDVIIPSSGIWIRIQYTGNFTGAVGVQGSMRNVEGTGDRLYQIPATGKIIDADIRKMDNSGKELVVIIYNNGTAVNQGSTKTPGGTLSLSTDLRIDSLP